MNFKHWMKNGFVSIEAVITGAIILSVGFVALSNLSVNGSAVVRNSLNKLDASGVFEEVATTPEPVPFDPTAYAASLGITESDVNPESDFTFVTVDGGVRITGYNSPTDDKTLVIPKTINELSVVELSGLNNKGITSVAIPNTVKVIDASAFSFNALTSIIIPNGVTTLGNNSFEGNQISALVIPASVNSLGGEAFMSNQLSEVTFMGPRPELKGFDIFQINPGFDMGFGTLYVPYSYYEDYQDYASWFTTFPENVLFY